MTDVHPWLVARTQISPAIIQVAQLPTSAFPRFIHIMSHRHSRMLALLSFLHRRVALQF